MSLFMQRVYLHDWLASLSSHHDFGYHGKSEAVSVSIWFETLIRLRGILRDTSKGFDRSEESSNI
jgi:hypothetical protein